jgi:hypothetical protein
MRTLAITATPPTTRPLSAVAVDVFRTWNRVYFGAVPCLQAMRSLGFMDDTYGQEGADTALGTSGPRVDMSAVLEGAFYTFNVGSDELAAQYRGRSLRSLSVGDVAVVDGSPYVCASCGWEPVHSGDLRILDATETDRAIREVYDFRPDEALSVTVPLSPETAASPSHHYAPDGLTIHQGQRSACPDCSTSGQGIPRGKS